jgi:flagellar biosynthesis GTPase FlhF
MTDQQTAVYEPAPDDDEPKRARRKVAVLVAILAVVASIAWGIPIANGFHFGCNPLAGDKFREARLGIEMCRGENSSERSQKEVEARVKGEAEQAEQRATEKKEAEEQREQHEKEEAERPKKETEERAEKEKEKHEQEQTEREQQKMQEAERTQEP